MICGLRKLGRLRVRPSPLCRSFAGCELREDLVFSTANTGTAPAARCSDQRCGCAGFSCLSRNASWPALTASNELDGDSVDAGVAGALACGERGHFAIVGARRFRRMSRTSAVIR
jgi:hypothetical protein